MNVKQAQPPSLSDRNFDRWSALSKTQPNNSLNAIWIRPCGLYSLFEQARQSALRYGTSFSEALASIKTKRYDMKIFKWIKRALFGILILVILLLIIGFIFEQISRSNAENLIPHGEFANVGGHKLHYYKKGEDGSTVVF